MISLKVCRDRLTSMVPALQLVGSIRGRVLLLVLLAVLPLVAQRIYSLHVERDDRIELASLQLLDLAKQGIHTQEAIIASTQAMLQTVAVTVPHIGDPEKSDCRNFFERIREPLPWVHSVIVVLSDGQTVCSNRPQLIGLDLSNRPYVMEAKAKNSPLLSEFFIGPKTGQPVVAAIHPVLRGNPVTDFMLIATIDLSWISKLIEMPAARGDAVTFIVDANGQMIARYPNPQKWNGRTFLIPKLFASLPNDDAVITADDIDDQRRIFAAVKLNGENARLVVGVSEAQIISTIDRQIYLAYAAIFLVLAPSLLAAWFGGNRFIIRPIETLVATARAVEHGDYAAIERPAHEPSEFKPLVHALGSMAERLQQRETEMKIANARLDQLAQYDALTELGNRRSFDLHLALEETNARLAGEPLALLMVDVDHFKEFNDLYGHVAGDACLREIAQAITKVVRHGDFAARYGGEEFAILVPGLGLNAAEPVAERLRQGIRALGVPHERSPHRVVTISVGLASVVPSGEEAPERLVERADAALYRAKKQGRDRVVTLSEQLPLAS